VIVLNEGAVVAVDTYEQLAARLRNSDKTLVRAARPSADLPKRLGTIAGVRHVTAGGAPGELLVESDLGADVREHVARAVVESGVGLLELRSLSMSLEDVFLKLVTHEDGPAQSQGPAKPGDGGSKGVLA
jgi:ABC-2 type transport system ATP-binding protein